MGVAAVFASGISASQNRPPGQPHPHDPPTPHTPTSRDPHRPCLVFALFFFLFLSFRVFFFLILLLDVLFNIYHIFVFRLICKFYNYSSNLFPKSYACHNILLTILFRQYRKSPRVYFCLFINSYHDVSIYFA